LSGEQRFNKRTLVLFAGAIMGIGLVFSASRAGIISAAGAMLCMGLFFIFRKNYRRKGLIILFLFLVTSVYALHIGADYPVERFKYFDLGIKERARLTQKTIDLFNDYRLTGVGVGNFQYAYPKYQSAEDKKSFIRHAHNDWAQFLAEGGIAGFSILLIALFYYIFRTIKFWVKRTDPFAICLGITPLVVITAIAIHSYFDFNLHIPANCMMLTAIMAIGHSALYLEKHRGRDKTSYHYHAMPLRYKGFLALLFVLSFIIWNGSWAIRHFIAEAYCNTVTNSTLNRDQNPALGEINKAIEWDRWNAAYWYKRAHELMRIRNAETVNLEDDEYKIKRQMEIISALEQAVSLNPFRAEYHMTLGWEYVYLWKAPDYYVKWLPAADISMERAAYFAGEKSPYLHLTLGNYWIFRSKTITPSRAQWETAWGKAIRHYKKAQSLERSKIFADKILQYVWKYYPDREYVRKTLLKENQILLDPI
ncbi:MAG TPA: O-antigen ligase family protein, partial [Desulfatiglandales bacterium]|nr:O-antigen ligase family protein [Desulfatiglandales bacterium]